MLYGVGFEAADDFSRWTFLGVTGTVYVAAEPVADSVVVEAPLELGQTTSSASFSTTSSALSTTPSAADAAATPPLEGNPAATPPAALSTTPSAVLSTTPSAGLPAATPPLEGNPATPPPLEGNLGAGVDSLNLER